MNTPQFVAVATGESRQRRRRRRRRPVRLAATVLLWLLAACGAPAGADQKDAMLDALFAELQEDLATPRAAAITKQIWERWTNHHNEQAGARMELAARAMSARNFRTALRHLDQVITITPDFAEAWNRRATVYYVIQEYQRSLADVVKTLELEPRHFGALSGRGLIYMQLEQYDEAVSAFRDALQHNPHLSSTKKNLRAAEKKLYGDPI